MNQITSFGSPDKRVHNLILVDMSHSALSVNDLIMRYVIMDAIHNISNGFLNDSVCNLIKYLQNN